MADDEGRLGALSFMDAYMPRVLDRELDYLLANLPAVLIDGPKGVGKTAMARQRAVTEWALDDPAQHQILNADPSVALSGEPTVLLDEWQRLPKLWDAVRRSVDADMAPGRFILTGSAPTGSSHSGAGRISTVRMRPLALTERVELSPTVSMAALLSGSSVIGGASSMTLTDYVEEIVAGGFPGMRGLAPRALRVQLDGYIDRIIDHDFPEYGLMIKRPETLRAWLRAHAAATSSTASLETIRRAAASSGGTSPAKETVQSYLDLLGRLRIIDPLPAWLPGRNHYKRLTGAPKHHLADPALAARLLRTTPATLLSGGSGGVVVKDGTLLGVLFESLVALSVRTFAQANECATFHLRTKGGAQEVDFIVEADDGTVVGFEVKLSAEVDDRDVRHLLWLRDKATDLVADLVVITTGTHAYRRADGVAVVPLALLTV